TSPVRPVARDAAMEAIARGGNPSSVHRDGRRARALLDDAREAVAGLVGARPRQIVFTSGGTEANNLALRGCGRARLLVSAVEHPSVLQVRDDGVTIPVDADGCLDLVALERLLAETDEPALVSVMAANNETGVIQPIAEVIELAHRHGALVHSDAVQAAGKITGAWAEADLVTLSAHKFGGLQGAGALVVGNGGAITAQARGGGQELGYRAGTEALPAIAAFGAAAREVGGDDVEQLGLWRDTLEDSMKLAVPGAEVLGGKAGRLPNTLALAHPAIDAETMVMSFDLQGISISAGSACSSGKMAASHVAQAMGRSDLARRAVRLSLGWSTTRADCERAAEVWSIVHARHANTSHAA
ncbi:MAG: cysteine desulfurase, partial [Rhodospirillaceae bacterium]|nr:cysteine desulfurase [Rhodospirillaceae bacterium]